MHCGNIVLKPIEAENTHVGPHLRFASCVNVQLLEHCIDLMELS